MLKIGLFHKFTKKNIWKKSMNIITKLAIILAFTVFWGMHIKLMAIQLNSSKVVLSWDRLLKSGSHFISKLQIAAICFISMTCKSMENIKCDSLNVAQIGYMIVTDFLYTKFDKISFYFKKRKYWGIFKLSL